MKKQFNEIGDLVCIECGAAIGIYRNNDPVTAFWEQTSVKKNEWVARCRDCNAKHEGVGASDRLD